MSDKFDHLPVMKLNKNIDTQGKSVDLKQLIISYVNLLNFAIKRINL